MLSDLELSTPVLTPNGDGVNDRLDIRFIAFKIEGRMPRAGIYDLAGRLVAQLSVPAIDGAAHTFTWSGRGSGGGIVPPGAYLLRLDLGADAGDDTVLRGLAVAY